MEYDQSQFIGRQCKVFIEWDDNLLVYSGTLINISAHFTFFIDRYRKPYIYNNNKVMEIQILEGDA